MPKEIEKEPEGFYEEIPYLRMEFSELVDVLETMNLEVDQINATSNDAKFEGLDDIKSAPARFSGQPTLFVIRRDSDEDLASAKVQFENRRTTICAGKYRYGTFNKVNNELAKSIFEELLPFKRRWEHISSLACSWGEYILFVCLILIAVFVFGDRSNLSELGEVFQILIVVLQICALLVFVGFLLKRRAPIIYRPRRTFWQKHGEATIVGVIGSVATALIVGFFKCP